jgi:hypothetical protein
MLLFLLLQCIKGYAQEEELIVPGQNLFVNNIYELQILAPWANGSGITVSIKEFQFDSSDVDLQGRVLQPINAATNLTTHAGIMASLVAGAGNADKQGRGVAPGCNLVSSSFVGLQPDDDYQTQQITVQNHSYGINIQNWYGAGAVAYDGTTEDNPALLHVFSAGNKADSASLSGTYAGLSGFANLSGNFKMAKNVLTVGGVDSLGRLDPFSSSGPAYDGRTKPDLVAFGLDGTSGAAALVSGAAAVLQQTLKKNLSGLPASSLVRALLLNTADDLAAPGPDFKTGFGNLNLKRAVLDGFNHFYSSGQLESNQTLSIPLNLSNGLRQCKLSLVWNDPTAAYLAPKALVHDLDLTLIDPNGVKHYPWILNTYPHPDSLSQAAHRGRDTLNNVEQITLNNPIEGLWQIQVSAPDMTGIQEFALAWHFDTLEHFEWEYPSLNVPAPAGREVILQWNNNFPDSIARLEWRPFLSTDWRLLEDSVDLQQGWRRWMLPDTFTEAQVSMRVGNHEFRSEVFMIAPELRLKIGFNCADSILLYWNKAHEQAHYWLFGLGKTQMEYLTTLTDTFIVFPKTVYPQQLFAVAPLAAEMDALGPRSSAPDINTQGVGCYFSSFLAGLNEDTQIALDLEIGSTYALQKVFFEKLVDGAFLEISEQVAIGTSYKYVDEQVQTGANVYRPKLLLGNGTILLGDTATVYWGGEKGWWVFPNPVVSGRKLNVVSATDSEAVFSLFDVLGKTILEKKLEDVNVEIELTGIPSGIYFFKINDGTLFLGEGKILIR